MLALDEEPMQRSRLRRFAQRCWIATVNTHIPRGAGLAASTLVILASLAYGAVTGGHVPMLLAAFKDARDAAANAAGFRIVSLALAGERHVTREEILAIAGITGRTSLLFLDVDEVREKLKTNPWIADATVLKLYPGELQIRVRERDAFALWQEAGRVSVIGKDGTVVEPYVAPHLVRLPLVVGRGAHTRAKDFLALLDRYPELRDQVRASILVAERRWNLRLKNGLDVRLPETDVPAAIERLLALDRDVKLMSRNILAIDLRLPDRVTVRLSDAAAQARLDKDKKDKKPAKKEGKV
jgi:cell division protein FtsQ